MANEKILNEEQLEAVQHKNGPLLIIAGAGTGKTTVITERIKYLILKKNIPPSEILALTFTEKAAQEMEERVDVAMPYGYTQMWISTFHAFCDRILRNEAIHIGLNPSYKLTTEAETILFLRQNLFKFNLDYFRPLGNPTKFLSSLLQHLSRLKDEDVSTEEYLAYAKKLNAKHYTLDAEKDEVKKTLELAYAYKIYEDLKVKEGIMDFADLIANTLKLFRTRNNLLKSYQDKFRHILLDEFQDTNFAQNTLSILLAGSKQNITVVGDDDQAIYRWRGAAISNIIQFRKQFPTAKIVTLVKNYRSTKEILNKSYDLIQHNNPDRLEIKEKVDKKLISIRNIKGKEVELLFADRVENEAELVVKKIKELVENKKYQYSDMAILIRANDYSQPFVRTLSRYNIPFQFLGPGQLFRQEEIKDLITYLKVLYNFEDSTSLYRVLNMPIFSLEPRDIAALLNFARRKNYTLFEAIEKVIELHLGGVASQHPRGGPLRQSFSEASRMVHPVRNSSGMRYEIFLKDDALEKFKTIFEMINRHLKLVPKNSAGQILFYFMEDSGLLKKFLSAKTEIEVKTYQNIARFFEKLKSYEAESVEANFFAVVDWIDLSMQMGESPLATDTDWTENNAVNILTIHSSKGLEFSIVFLVNLVSQRFPTRERREQIPIPECLVKEILPEGDFHLQEERRLFYVGMTRAKDFLFLTAANFYAEGKRERKLSPFVIETLGEEYINKFLQIEKSKKIAVQPSLLDWTPQKTTIKRDCDKNNLSKIVNRITYISYSQIQTFDICPLHYKLRYLLKVPTSQTAAQSFGTSIHSILRDLYYLWTKGQKVNVDLIKSLIDKNWINEGYTSKQHEEIAKKQARNLIANYVEKNFNPDFNPLNIILETPFQFYVNILSSSRSGIKIGGRIDRIDKLNNNKIEIIDYKTGSNIPDEKELKNNLQLTLYALAATNVNDLQLNKKPEDILLSLYYLELDKKITTTRTLEQLEAAKIEIINKVEEIESSDFLCKGSNFCVGCEYKMLCHT